MITNREGGFSVEINGLRLIVDSTVISNPTIAVRWCLPLGLLPEEAREPRVLIVLTNKEEWWEKRMIFPLGQLLTFIPLYWSGKTKIKAFLLWRSGTIKNLKTERRETNGFCARLLENSIGAIVDEQKRLVAEMETPTGVQPKQFRDKLTLEVPKEIFAKEPPAWLKRWVGQVFNERAKDQCGFRKRAAFALLAVPILWGIIAPVFSFVKILFALITLGLGFWNIDWREIARPFNSMDDLWRYKSDCPKQERFLFKRWPVLFCLMPLYYLADIVILSALAILIFNNILNFELKVSQGIIWQVLGKVGLVCAGLTFFIIIVSLIVSGVNRFSNSSKRRQRRQEARRQQEQAEQERLTRFWEEQRRDLVGLFCDSADLRPQVAALPPQKQTVSLRFWELKAKVCKPFSL